ncbi:MAG: LicD family protein [Mycoplasma sp.]
MKKKYKKLQKMSFEEIRLEQIELLKKIILFCDENKLRYSLHAGTLIGAVRNNGFIPWDDDIDIMMPKEDLDFLIKNYHDDNSFVLSHHSNKFYFQTITKLISSRTCGYEECRYKQVDEYGVFLDIFPIDYISSNRSLTTSHIKDLYCNYQFLISVNYKVHNFDDLITYLYLITSNKLKTKNKFKIIIFSPFVLLYALYKKHISGCKSIQKKFDSNPLNDPSINDADKMMMFLHWDDWNFDCALNLSNFENYKIIKFEGIDCKIINNYDTFLRNSFEIHYMQLPPEEERIPRHNLVMFWK